MGLDGQRLWFDAIFGATVLAAALLGLTAAGHFPRSERLARMQSGLGVSILWSSIVMTCGAIGVAVWTASRAVPWTEAVISGSLAVLVAPMILQRFPDRFVDGRRGLMTWTTLAVSLSGWLLARS